MPGIKRNILYSGILMTSNYVFPLLVYPYVSRVLGVEKIGLCGFVDSIINYFMLFSMMGMMIMGTREIARLRSAHASLDGAFSSLLSLNGLATVAALALLAAATLTVPDLREHADMMVCGAVKLVSNFFLIEWFYRGLENFRFITLRTVLVKCFYVAAVFVFVKAESDYVVYYLLTALMVTVNAVINMLYSRRFARFTMRKVCVKEYVAPFFILGVYMIFASMYTTFNSAYLGFVCGDVQVGYYTTATKLYTIIIGIFTAFTGVMLPHMSALISDGRIDEFKEMLVKSWDVLVSFSVPAILFAVIFAPQIVLIISGEGYDGAVVPMRIVMPLILIIGIEQILVIQALMPLKKDRVIMRNSIIAALLSVVLNVALVHSLQSVGSAIVWVVCETTVLILSLAAVRSVMGVRLPLGPLGANILAYLPLAAILWGVSVVVGNPYWQFVSGAAVSLCWFVAVNLTVFRASVCGKTIMKFLKR